MDEPESQTIDAILRLPNRAVWVLTSAHESRRGGLLATWVLQASIDPERPTLAASIAFNHFTRELIDASGAFTAHLLAPEQTELALQFALGSGRDRDKLADLAWKTAATGSPILPSSLAWLDCRVYDRHDGGDRIYYWADVLKGELVVSQSEPLTERELIAAASDDQKRQLRQGMEADIAVARQLRTINRLP